MKFLLPPNIPEGQHKAIMTNAKLITVSAGAGSGKTWVLSNRYARLLLESKDLLPADILTLTFTEAAAGEMKNRIEAIVISELEKVEDSERKQAILDGLSDLWISTIHSFAARLIRESGLSLDIDPKASVISKHQEEDFWEGVKNAVEFANLRELARAYGNKILRDAAKSLDEDEYLSASVNKWGARNLSKFAMETAELHASAGNTWKDMLDWSENDTLIEATKPKVKDMLSYEWREVWDIWAEIISKESIPSPTKPEGTGANFKALLDWQKYHLGYYYEDNLRFFYESLVIDNAKNLRGNAGEPFKTVKNLLKMTLGDWRKTRPELYQVVTKNFGKEFSPEEIRMRKTLLKFCAVCWGMWDKMKTRRGLLSFSDMILYAKEAISKGGINRKFKHVLIDEFQDTDQLQFDMIQAMIDSSEDTNTNLFAVGDPKQSIYGFRHADPSLFADTIDKAKKNSDSEFVELDKSFRTRDQLIRRINNVFESLWVDGLGQSKSMKGLKYNKLWPAHFGETRDGGTMPVFKIMLARHDRSSTNEARKNLAENLALKIYSWVNEGRTVWDKREGIIRPVKYSDFAVLSRSRGIYPTLEEAFERFGIKTIQDTSNDFFSRGEVNDVVCLLRAAADVNDSFALTGWLMSPFSGIDEEDVIEALPLVNKSHSPIELIKEKFPEAYSRLEYFKLIGENEGPAALLSILDKNRKWLSCYRDIDRLRVLRNLRKAISIAGSFQASGTATLTACAEYLTRSIRNNISVEEPEWNDQNENAVRLGVVHSAKGLEYPVTVIFEHRIHKNADYGLLKPSRELGVVFSKFPDEIVKSNLDRVFCSDWDKLLSRQGDLEEETRLFYVAATRAQDSLIFCGLVNASDDKPHNNTWTKFLLDNGRTFDPEYIEALNNENFPEINSKAEENLLTSVNIVHAKNSLRQISATSFALFEWCPFAWRRKYKQGLELSWENEKLYDNDNDDDENYSGGANVGSLTHWILSHWPRSEDYKSELQYLLHDREILGQLPGILRRTWRNEKDKANITKWLMNFAATERGKTLMYEKNIRREYSFNVRLNQETNLAGSIDAWYDNNVIDYKITAIEDAPQKLYEAQLEFYAYIVHELTGAETVNTCTAFLREGKFLENVYNDFDGIKARISQAAEICASGPYNANIANCASCPFKKGCVRNAGK